MCTNITSYKTTATLKNIRKSNFYMKIKYKTTSNLLYHAVQKFASDELAELLKLLQ